MMMSLDLCCKIDFALPPMAINYLVLVPQMGARGDADDEPGGEEGGAMTDDLSPFDSPISTAHKCLATLPEFVRWDSSVDTRAVHCCGHCMVPFVYVPSGEERSPPLAAEKADAGASDSLHSDADPPFPDLSTPDARRPIVIDGFSEPLPLQRDWPEAYDDIVSKVAIGMFFGERAPVRWTDWVNAGFEERQRLRLRARELVLQGPFGRPRNADGSKRVDR